MNTWKIRREILLAAHRWYWVVTSFLVGALLGWIIGLILPTPYRAVKDVYVGLNAYRATRDLYIAEVADSQFRNLDDYKNWQMSQLNSLALSDEYLTETLFRLHDIDKFWQEIDLPELRSMLAIAWRNTGDWHFSARAENPIWATQAVSIWSEVVIEKVSLAVDAARQLVVIDSQLQAVSKELTDLENRHVLLQETQTALYEWRTFLNSNLSEQTLPPAVHWALISQVANAASWNVGWVSLMEDAPPNGSLLEDYLGWLDRVDGMIDAELSTIPAQIHVLASKKESLNTEYTKAADDSKALSANLAVQILNTEQPQLTRLRETGTMIVIGGLLGLLFWGFGWLVQVTRRTQ
ncbi:MAG: hypothetical protein ACK2U1_26045 [Anaerolineales bacterium]